MQGRSEEAAAWLVRAAERYRESWPAAPPESWGRPIGAMKSRLIAGDLDGARADAHWALDAGAAKSESPIGRYAAALASPRDAARTRPLGQLVSTLVDRDDFPSTGAADSLAGLSARDPTQLREGDSARSLEDFEARAEFLEDIPVADTVLSLQALAASRGFGVPLTSPLLPT